MTWEEQAALMRKFIDAMKDQLFHTLTAGQYERFLASPNFPIIENSAKELVEKIASFV